MPVFLDLKQILLKTLGTMQRFTFVTEKTVKTGLFTLIFQNSVCCRKTAVFMHLQLKRTQKYETWCTFPSLLLAIDDSAKENLKDLFSAGNTVRTISAKSMLAVNPTDELNRTQLFPSYTTFEIQAIECVSFTIVLMKLVGLLLTDVSLYFCKQDFTTLQLTGLEALDFA